MERYTDVDDLDLETYFHLMIDDRDNIEVVDGNSYTLNVFTQGLPYGEVIQWWVEVSDGDTSTISEVRTLLYPMNSIMLDLPGLLIQKEVTPMEMVHPTILLEQSSMPTMCLLRMIRLSLTRVHTLGILFGSLPLVGSILFGQRPILDGGNMAGF